MHTTACNFEISNLLPVRQFISKHQINIFYINIGESTKILFSFDFFFQFLNSVDQLHGIVDLRWLKCFQSNEKTRKKPYFQWFSNLAALMRVGVALILYFIFFLFQFSSLLLLRHIRTFNTLIQIHHLYPLSSRFIHKKIELPDKDYWGKTQAKRIHLNSATVKPLFCVFHSPYSHLSSPRMCLCEGDTYQQ